MPPKRKQDYPCLKCDVHVKSNAKAIQCYLCNQWLHKDCSDVTNEVYQFLKQQNDYQGGTFWACQACRVVAIKFDKRMKELDKRIDEVEATANENKTDIKALQTDIVTIKESVANEKPDLTKVQSATTSSVFNEISERDKRKLNIVVHGLDEAGKAIKDGKDRAAFDIGKLQELIDELDLELDAQDRELVRFAKRLGQPTDGATPRPLLVGLGSSEMVEEVTSVANKSLKTKPAPWSGKSVVRDLTAMQRTEEKKLYTQADDLNKQLNADDAKKFIHKVVGPRGERRIAKLPRKQT